MGRFGWILGMILLCGACAASEARTNSAVEGATAPQFETGGGHALVAPVLWVLGAIGVPVEDPAPLPNSERIERSQGWRDVPCAVQDEGNGVYFEVHGRVEFESAVVRFADGGTRQLPLSHAVRGGGLYLLCDFGQMARVEAVVLRARARSADAQVGVRLGR